jgi:hypothetical protein
MTRVAFLAAMLLAGTALAAAKEFTVVRADDEKVCAHFRTHHDSAPIKWQILAPSAEGDENARASFDFENTGKPQQVFRHEDRTYVFGGTYFLVAPPGVTVLANWFELLDMSRGFPTPPEPLHLYAQEDMNTRAEIAVFNKRTYVRTTPIREDINALMIFEARGGKLREICRYEIR